ncbi:MAG: hypothetical protein K2H13_06600 [Eubacterium sp.]|nr:hypothetical protein [Eubacterium sp.]
MSANLLTEKKFVKIIADFSKLDCNTEPEIYYVNNGAVLYKYNDVDINEYCKYCKKLLNDGYNQKGFAFLKNSEMLYVYYLKKERVLRVVFEPDAILPNKTILKNGKCELYQLSLNQEKVDCGMSYVLKLCDDSFFIIDGGYFTKGECDRLYQFLIDHTDDKINIAGWFCSHAHEDHFGCFMDFVEKYSNYVNIENLYYNFPNMYIPSAKNWKKDDIESTKRFYDMINKYLMNIPHIKLHTGQKFNIKNIEVEVLATHEDLYPCDFENFNDTSTVIRINVNGKSIMFLGDTGDELSDFLINVYGKNLKSDIVQVAHHGFNGAKKEVYELIDAVTVLWPTADYCFEENLNRDANKYLFKESKTAKEHIISGYGTKSIVL